MLFTGCDISDNEDVEKVLSRMSRFNDQVQGFLLSEHHLAPEYSPADITRPFPFNAFYGPEDIPQTDARPYILEILELVSDTRCRILP